MGQTPRDGKIEPSLELPSFQFLRRRKTAGKGRDRAEPAQLTGSTPTGAWQEEPIQVMGYEPTLALSEGPAAAD